MHRDGGGPGRVLVTGGASGLGAAVVEAVRAAGGTPAVLDRQAPARGAHVEIVDLRRPRDAEAATRRAVEALGGLDAVVTAAGTDACGELGEIEGDRWDDVVAVNLLSTAAVVRAALPALEASQGTVVTVASTLGLRALPAATAYCASKFGVVGFTRALASELAGRVRVTLLVPGGMATAFFDEREPQFRPPPDAVLNPPDRVAAAVMAALAQEPPCELRELVVAPSVEPSWP